MYRYQVGGKLAYICAFPGKEDVILFMDSLKRKVYYLDLSGWIPTLTRRPIKLDAFSSNWCFVKQLDLKHQWASFDAEKDCG